MVSAKRTIEALNPDVDVKTYEERLTSENVERIIGSLQANEALKLLLGAGESLRGRLVLFDALANTFDEVTVKRDPDCPVCGEHPTITEYIDYVEFCQGVRA